MRREGYYQNPDGLRIWYGLTGVADAETLILCDGIACDGFIWPHLIDALRPRLQLLRWHYRGHGRSDVPGDDEGLRLEYLADDLAGIWRQLGLAPSVVAGHSMGVQVALETYRRHPEMVRGLVLICGSYGNPMATFKGTDLGERLLPHLRSLVDRVPRVASALWTRLLPTRMSFWLAKVAEIHPRRVRRHEFFPYLEHAATLDLRVFLGMLAHAARHSALDVLARVEVPTLVVAGGNDGFTPPELSVAMAEAIPGAELLLLADGTHVAPLEYPDEINAAVGRFLSELGRDPGGGAE